MKNDHDWNSCTVTASSMPCFPARPKEQIDIFRELLMDTLSYLGANDNTIHGQELAARIVYELADAE